LMLMTPELEDYLIDEAKKLMYTKENKTKKVGD